MNIKSTLVNEYTVGGSLLLVGFGFFSTRFADVLSYRLTTLPSMIPVIGGATVTVGRVLGIVPATLGLAVLFRMAREVPVVSEATELPIVKTIVKYVDDLNEDMTSHIEIVPGQSGSFPLPGNSGTIKTTKWSPGIGNPNPYTDGLNPKEMAAEELLLCAEHDDYFNACGCGSESTESESVEMAAEMEVPKKKTTGSPKQQAWRSCVAEAKGDMAKAKQLYTAMGY
jgi:hypothetical protein